MNPRKILVIEDEKDMLELYALRLEHKGFRLLAASDGTLGLRLAKEESPDLILLDLMLPDINGIRICQTLKNDSRYRAIPIIILSARVDECTIKSGMSAGADCYMTKPFEWDEVYARILDLLPEEIPESNCF